MRVRAGEDEPKRSPEVAPSLEDDAVEFQAMKQSQQVCASSQTLQSKTLNHLLPYVSIHIGWIPVNLTGVAAEQSIHYVCRKQPNN